MEMLGSVSQLIMFFTVLGGLILAEVCCVSKPGPGRDETPCAVEQPGDATPDEIAPPTPKDLE